MVSPDIIALAALCGAMVATPLGWNCCFPAALALLFGGTITRVGALSTIVRKLRGGPMIDNRSQVFDLARKKTRAVGAFAACAFALCVVFGFTVVAAIIVAAT